MIKRSAVPAVAALFLLLTGISVHAGDMYKYTDRKGTVVITDRYDSIPDRYRNRVTVIKETRPAPLKESSSSGPPGATARQEAELSPSEHKPSGDDGWLKRYQVPLGLVAVVLSAFFVIRKIVAITGHRKLGALVFVVISVGISIYFYRLYVDKLSGTFVDLKKDALNIKNNVETREQMTDRALQQMPDKR